MSNTSIEFLKAVAEELDTGRLLRKFLDSLLALQKLERGSIWVSSEEGYHCLEAVGIDSEKVKGLTIPADRSSIVGWVIKNGKRTIAEPGKDERHFREVESGMQVKSRLILCFPLLLKSGEVYGAIELIETAEGKSRLNLDPHYLETLQQLIDLGSIAISNSLVYSDQVKENARLREALECIRGEEVIIGTSEALRGVLKTAESYARTDFPVLITGESGSGKELLARFIHRMSPRMEAPFVAQNCSAIPETLLESELFGYVRGAFTGAVRDQQGLFEAADGGTLFLDEIGDMPFHVQARLLRVFQSGEIKPVGSARVKHVDVRIISATNVDLKEAIHNKKFREDLYYRLGVLPLHLPPVRERVQDIPLLLNHFLNKEARRLGISPRGVSEEAMDVLLTYPWPGNIRELENFARQMTVLARGEVIGMNEVSGYLKTAIGSCDTNHGVQAPELRPQANASSQAASPQNLRPSFEGCSWKELEKAYVLHLLHKHKWHITRAAKEAGMNRTTFDSRMRKLGITRQGAPDEP